MRPTVTMTAGGAHLIARARQTAWTVAGVALVLSAVGGALLLAGWTCTGRTVLVGASFAWLAAAKSWHHWRRVRRDYGSL